MTNMGKSKQKRCGVTLIELMVVIAIITTLMALLLPAVRIAHGAARRAQCKSHLKQIAMAFQMHHDTFKHLPSGGWGHMWFADANRGYGPDQPAAWPYTILPFIEQTGLREIGEGSDNPAVDMLPLLQYALPLFYCPSRRAAEPYPWHDFPPRNLAVTLPAKAPRTDYAANGGNKLASTARDRIIFRTAGSCEGPRNYETAEEYFNTTPTLGIAENDAPTGTGHNGVCHQVSEVRFRDLTDGTSTTYLVTEKPIELEWYRTGESRSDNAPVWSGYSNDLIRWTGRITLDERSGRIIRLPLGPNQDFIGFENGMGGPHPGAFQVAMADGSTRSISYFIDWEIHRLLGGRDDGVPVPGDY